MQRQTWQIALSSILLTLLVVACQPIVVEPPPPGEGTPVVPAEQAEATSATISATLTVAAPLAETGASTSTEIVSATDGITGDATGDTTDDGSADGSDSPLATELALPNGDLCLFAGTGATLALDGERVTHTCGDPMQVLLGEPSFDAMGGIA